MTLRGSPTRPASAIRTCAGGAEGREGEGGGVGGDYANRVGIGYIREGEPLMKQAGPGANRGRAESARIGGMAINFTAAICSNQTARLFHGSGPCTYLARPSSG